MRALLLTIATTAALGSGAQASILSSNFLPSSPTSPFTLNSTPIVFFDRTSSLANVYRSPFEGTSNPNGAFTSVEGTGSAIFNVKGDKFTFVWGSPDKYNQLNFYSGANGNGSLLGTFNGSEVTPYSGSTGTPTTAGLGYSFVTISDIGKFGSVKMSNSPGDNAFEFSTISAVPLPASAPLFGAALLAMAGFGYARRSRRAVSPTV